MITITTTMARTAPAAVMSMGSMSIITMMKRAAAMIMKAMSIIMTTAKTAPAAATIMTHHHHHHADEVFTSWGMETIVPVTRDQLEDILKRLADTKEFGDVLRAKGMLPTENPGEWLYFDLVPQQYEIRQGQSRLYRQGMCHRSQLEGRSIEQPVWKRLKRLI